MAPERVTGDTSGIDAPLAILIRQPSVMRSWRESDSMRDAHAAIRRGDNSRSTRGLGGSALRYQGRKWVHHADDMIARITAEAGPLIAAVGLTVAH
jgi:hypothetical protein